MEITDYCISEDIDVLYVEAESFPEGIANSFKKLHDTVGGFSGKHMYGITLCLGDKLVYRACIKEDFKGKGEQYGLQNYTIPAGNYLHTTLHNWQENLAQIPEIFDELMRQPNVKKQSICLEDYTTDDKMLALVQQA